MRRRSALLFALLSGCAPDPQPVQDPLDYLRVGADFEGDANTFAEQVRSEGWSVERIQHGRTFAALQARDEERALVRVWSRRGLVVAIDAPAPEHWRRDVLLAPPTEATDLDGDGHEELVIGATDDAMGRTCFAIVRIDGEGYAKEVTPTYVDLGGDGCVEGFEAEPLRAVVVVRFPKLASRSVPQVPVPHGATESGEWIAQPAPDFVARERARRQRAHGAGELSPHRAAVELAALAHLAGEDTGAQLAVFDATIGAEVDAAASAARARIADGWRDPEPEVEGAEPDAPEPEPEAAAR